MANMIFTIYLLKSDQLYGIMMMFGVFEIEIIEATKMEARKKALDIKYDMLYQSLHDQGYFTLNFLKN